MGGWKASGLGSRHGAAGHPQVLPPAVAARDALRAAEGPARSIPFRPRTTKLIGRGAEAALRPRQALTSATPPAAASPARPGSAQLAPQPAAAAVLQAVDRVLGAAQPLGDLARREPDQEAQHDHVALLGRQRVERQAQVREALAAARVVLERRARGPPRTAPAGACACGRSRRCARRAGSRRRTARRAARSGPARSAAWRRCAG